MSLWLFATLEGMGSARELARRCERDIPDLWMLGGVTVNHHTLSDLRVRHGARLKRLLVDTVAALVDRGLVPLETIAPDGMRVKARAGNRSFRRKETLETLQKQAQEQVDRLKNEAANEGEGPPRDARCKAATERAARERQARIEEALQPHEQLSQQREAREKGAGEKTRVSTTDPDARQMKMANGGYDPAFNVQFATAADSRVIVEVDVTNQGTDAGELPPMLAPIQANDGQTPQPAWADSADATQETVTTAEAAGTLLVSSVPRAEQLRKHGKDPHSRQRKDTDADARFRSRMAEPSYQLLYKQRPSVAEFANADCRNRNLRQFRVRGLLKVKAIALWHALAFNFTRFMNLGVLTS